MTTKSRDRARGGLTPGRIDFEVFSTSNPTPVVSSLPTGSMRGVRQVMRDKTSTGWRRNRKERGWINNPAESSTLSVTLADTSTTTVNEPSGGVQTTRTWSGDTLGFLLGPVNSNGYGDLKPSQYPDLTPITPLLNGAIIECLSRVNPPSSQSLVTVAELPKTINLIASTAKKFVDARRFVVRFDVLNLKRMFGDPPPKYRRYPGSVVLWNSFGEYPLSKRDGTPRKGASRRKLTNDRLSKMDEASKLWLEYRYGWAPIVYDLIDQLKALDAELLRLQKAAAQGSEYVYKKATGLRSATNSSTHVFNTGVMHGGDFVWQRDISHEIVVRAYAYYRVVASGILSRLNDFGAFEIPRAIVELCPFSFIADWFIPLSDWVGALTPKFGVEILASGYRITNSKSVKRTLVGYHQSPVGPGTWPTSPIAIGTSDRAENYQWARHVGLPVPTFPPLEVKLNLKRLADAAALMRRMR